MGKKIGKVVKNNTQKKLDQIKSEVEAVNEVSFNDVEQDYLLKNKTLPPATLAKALATSVDKVTTFLNDLPKNISMFDKVIGKSKDKNNKTRSVVMTGAASEISDANKQKVKLDPGCVHKCKGD